MHIYNVIPNAPVEPHSPSARLRAQFPWLGAGRIEISDGLLNVLRDFCAQVQAILGPEPELDFLYVFDEPDLEDPFRTQLLMFIEPKTSSVAQRRAIEHFQKKAVTQAAWTCRCCGCALTYGDGKGAANLGSRRTLSCLFCVESAEGGRSDGDPQDAASDFDSADPFRSFPEYDEDEETPVDAFSAAAGEAGEPAEEALAASETGGEAGAVEASRGPMLQVFEQGVVEALEKELKLLPRDREKQLKTLVDKLKAAGPDKRLALQPEDWRDYCDRLVTLFPNFEAVITFIRHQMALSAIKDRVFALPPFLLMGPPGIGKTEFLLTLAQDVDSTVEVIDISAAQTGIALTGSEAYWSNTQTGTLFNVLALGPIANPILLLDEIDKARKDQAYNPLAALHQLLEPRQARQFKDLSVPALTLDASRVIWAATGNELGGIDKPILDRFAVFEIAEPSAEQMRAIAQNQYRRALERWDLLNRFDPELSPETLAAIIQFRPRQVRKIFDNAIGRAAYHQRERLTVEDIQASHRAMPGIAKARIGFV